MVVVDTGAGAGAGAAGAGPGAAAAEAEAVAFLTTWSETAIEVMPATATVAAASAVAVLRSLAIFTRCSWSSAIKRVAVSICAVARSMCEFTDEQNDFLDFLIRYL